MSTARLRQEHPKITPRPERASTLMFGRQSIKVKGEGGLRQHGNVAVRWPQYAITYLIKLEIAALHMLRNVEAEEPLPT